MPYLITMRRREGQGPIPVHAPGMNAEAARLMCSKLALTSKQVVLSELDGNGIPTVIERWVGGKVDTSRLTAKRPVIIDHEPDVATAFDNLRAAAGQVIAATENIEAEDDEEIAAAVEADEDESHRFTAQCMKCREKREFVGRVVEMTNGSHAAKGNCPVCGTGMFRMVSRSTPIDPEWDDDEPAESPVEAPATEPEAPEPEAEPATLTEAVEAGIVSAPEFSDAVAEDAALAPAVAEVIAEKPARKTRTRKAKDQAVEPPADTELERVKEMQVAPCPICGQSNVPYQTRSGVTYFLTHPGRDGKGNPTDRCQNSLGSDGLAKIK